MVEFRCNEILLNNVAISLIHDNQLRKMHEKFFMTSIIIVYVKSH